MTLDDRVFFVLHNATAPLTAGALASRLGDGTTAVLVRRAIDRLRRRGIGVVNWSGAYGGYIARHREDLLYVTVGSVIAECDALAARKSMH